MYLECDFHLDPLLIIECGPHVVRLGDGALAGFENDTCTLMIDMQRTEDKDETREGGVGGNALEPIIVQVELDTNRNTW
jgi:hypothetical protein